MMPLRQTIRHLRDSILNVDVFLYMLNCVLAVIRLARKTVMHFFRTNCPLYSS